MSFDGDFRHSVIGAAGFSKDFAEARHDVDIVAAVKDVRDRLPKTGKIELRAVVFVGDEACVHDHLTPKGERCSGTSLDPFEMAARIQKPVIVSVDGKEALGITGLMVARPGAKALTAL